MATYIVCSLVLIEIYTNEIINDIYLICSLHNRVPDALRVLTVRQCCIFPFSKWYHYISFKSAGRVCLCGSNMSIFSGIDHSSESFR